MKYRMTKIALYQFFICQFLVGHCCAMDERTTFKFYCMIDTSDLQNDVAKNIPPFTITCRAQDQQELVKKLSGESLTDLINAGAKDKTFFEERGMWRVIANKDFHLLRFKLLKIYAEWLTPVKTLVTSTTNLRDSSFFSQLHAIKGIDIPPTIADTLKAHLSELINNNPDQSISKNIAAIVQLRLPHLSELNSLFKETLANQKAQCITASPKFYKEEPPKKDEPPIINTPRPTESPIKTSKFILEIDEKLAHFLAAAPDTLTTPAQELTPSMRREQARLIKAILRHPVAFLEDFPEAKYYNDLRKKNVYPLITVASS